MKTIDPLEKILKAPLRNREVKTVTWADKITSSKDKLYQSIQIGRGIENIL